MKHIEWARSAAAGIAAAHPLDGGRCRAGGNHLVADNDEPEPTLFSDEELTEADLELSRGKAQRRARREQDRARALDLQMRDAGLLR